MTEREKLPNRRAAESFNFEVGGFHYIATVGRFDDGRIAEVFLGNGKCGSTTDVAARDSAVVASLALQFGVPLESLRRALLRDGAGRPGGPLGALLDILAAEQPA